ncbi:uncharacterized protein LOC114279971 isoform X6 [Camellia sinensis]|uniref:uncharacterized protein LOC114279971 isoform X6 n=1 Tax=Camellia sinensis TaxID=4442 RepID=UPI0010365067|nr:uncharacterized protein LOC114279971 isoform X6 [Camellia sinensis]
MQQELEEEKAPENLSKKISTISLTGADKEGFDMFGKCVGFVKFNADVVDKATGKKVPNALSGHRESTDYETDENPHTPPPDDEMQPLLST